ncbi:MAG TPA: hypothetical protein VFU22_17615 [Roseiflexaceae bacterium]|nr:hypothetical protein [Roseiflexaceae bacterium]
MEQPERTISSILLELADEYQGVVSEREVFDRVLGRRPSQAKDPHASIRNKLRYDSIETGWVRLGGGELIPRRIVLQGLRFRINPSDDEFANDMLSRVWMVPFASLRQAAPRLEDANGRPLQTYTTSLPAGESGLLFTAEAQSVGDWFKRTGFEPGDSVLVTISNTAPLTLQIERERAAVFRADEVAAQEIALVEDLAAQIARNRANMLLPDDVVLPAYARAAWRTSYPGRPWQQLVAADRRMRLVDGIYLADSSFRRPLDLLFGDEQQAELWEEQDRELFDEIAAFQADLLASRREAATRGLWNGEAPRASTGRVIFDMRDGTSQVIHPGIVDALADHTAEIEQRVERGDYADEEWDDEIDADEIDDMEFEDEFEGDELFDIEDIEDMQAFMEQNPALVEATQKLMASLSPAEVEELQAAETPDQVQRILTSHLNSLLGRDPALFAELTPTLPVAHTNGNGNGNGHGPGHEELLAIEAETEWVDDEEDDDQWIEDEDEDEIEAVSEVIERSNEWMERFYQAQIQQGKSESTAASRTGDLWIYADFLSSYYNRNLAEGDYATLDECLFFFYPRKVINNSPRAAREICTSVKQFYAFLRAEGVIADDSFAQAIWRRRDQAARAVELYDRIDGDSPQFERLFAHLFAPYTA